MEPIMYAPWRLAALAFLVIALPVQAQHHKSRSHSNDDDDVESRIDTTVAIGHSGTVDLQSFSGDITVIGWDRNDVKIHATSGSQLHFESSASRVSLVETPEDRNYSDNDDNHYGFEVSMPRSARLLVRSLSGDIKLHDVSDVEAHSVSGDLDAANIATHAIFETVSGDVTVVHVAAGVRANSVSGEIRAKQITGEVEAQSVSGDIVLDDVTSAFVRSESVSGDTRFTGPIDPKGRYEFHSHSGDVQIDLTGGGSDATLDVETYSGDLDTSCAMTMQPGGNGNRMGKRGTFTLGHGGGAHFILKTFSGDVRITGCRSHGDK
jgi:hypothetical protein